MFALNLSSCSTVKVKDGEWCADADRFGASCFHTLSNSERDIPKEEWDKVRVGWLCTNSENFANWKEALLKLCKMAGKRCRYDVKRQIMSFHNKVEERMEWIHFNTIDYVAE